MECVPWLSALVLHCAVRVLPLPPRATAAQPAMELPPSVKLTLPVGLDPVTDAVKVTLLPTVDGLAELDSAAVDVVGGGNDVHDGNLNDPMRVCQLPALPLIWPL